MTLMRNAYEKKTYSIRTLFLSAVLIVTALVISFVLVIYAWSDRWVTQKAMDLGQTSLRFYAGMLDQNLLSIDNYSYQILYENQDMTVLSETADPEQRFFAKKSLGKRFEQLFQMYQVLDGVLFYAPDAPQEQWLISANARIGSVSESRTVQREFLWILENFADQEFPVDWFLHPVDGKNCLFRIVRTPKGYYMFWIKEETLHSFYQVGDGAKLSLLSESEPPEGKERYQISIPSDAGDFSLCGTLDVSASLAVTRREIFILRMLSIFLLMFPVVLILFFLRLFYRMYHSLYTSMQKVGKGDLNVRIKESSQLREVDFLFDTFNSMTSEIQNLKIENYEKTISQQRIQLQYLQVQLKSHFFLNCLNIIYSLAQVRDYPLIQKMALCLTDYFRYIGQDTMEFVTLQKELAHIRNYLEIQSMRFPGKFRTAITEPEHPESCWIPPLILQTFLENSIKYAVQYDKVMELTVVIEERRAGDARGLDIIISDNGKGFSEELLEELNDQKPSIEMNLEHGVGIHNVCRRLELLYQGASKISFSNLPDGGARVEMFLPQRTETDQERTCSRKEETL